MKNTKYLRCDIFSSETAQEELEEFQSESRQLEEELERQLELLEKKNNELNSANQRLTRERDGLRVRYFCCFFNHFLFPCYVAGKPYREKAQYVHFYWK